MHTPRSVLGGLVAHVLLAAICLTGVARAQIAGENVNMVSGARWPGGDPYLQRQNEPTMAVSSVNPQHLMAGANDYRSVDVPDPVFGKPIIGDAWLGVFKSLDGGQTWKSVLLPGYPQECVARAAIDPPLPVNPLCGYPAAADPVMRAGTDGLFYFGGINFLRDKTQSRIFVARFIDDNNKENGSATGDPALADPNDPTAFTPTDPIRYLDTVEVWSSERNKAEFPTAPLMFMDKPWIAVDVPRGGVSCEIPLPTPSGGYTSILAGTVYMAWAQFYPDDYQSDIMLSSSTNCGANWSKPRKLNTGNSTANQGVAIAIEPVTGRVYVAWRRAPWPRNVASPRQTDAIMVTRSEGRRRNFSAPRAIAKMIPFDMGNGWGRARTQTMPSIAISSTESSSWAHVAWAARVAPDGQSRIFMSTAKIHPKPSGEDDEDDPEELDEETRLGWSVPAIADPTEVKDDAGHIFTRGHQYMPSLTFGQGRLMLFYYDTRLDHTVRYYKPITPTNGKFYEEELGPVGGLAYPDADENGDLIFGPEVDDGTLKKIRHTIDVRVASLPWGIRTTSGSTLVSRFPLGIRGDERKGTQALPVYAPAFGSGGSIMMVDNDGYLLREQQLQMNIPGFPMFKGGTFAFMGDYIDIQGPAFVPVGNGGWRFNIAPAAAPVFHAIWTSNQDVKTPYDGDWTKYTPVTARLRGPNAPPLYDGGRAGEDQRSVLLCDPGSAGSRDQNIYTSRITEGLLVSSPQNAKLLSAEPVGFVIAAQNQTASEMTVSFEAPTLPSGVAYSWTNFDPEKYPASLSVKVAPFSGVHRTLFVKLAGSLNSAATVNVTVRETGSCGGTGQPACRSGFVTLNPPIALSQLVQPDGDLPDVGLGEVYSSVLVNPSLSNPNPAPSLSNPSLSNPSLSNPSLSNPSLSNPSLSNPSLSNPSLSNPSLSNPSLSNPSLSNPSLSNPSLSNPSLSNPSLSNAPPTDLSYTIANSGNTTTSYHVKVVGDASGIEGPLQLVLSKTYKTPTAVGCDLKEVPHDQVVVSVPDIRGAIVPATAVVDPGASDPSLSNATLALAPGDSATITLRGYMTPGEMAALGSQLAPAPVPSAVVPAPNVTYVTWPQVTGQPPFVRAATATAVTHAAGLFTATVGLAPGGPAQAAPPTGQVTFIRNGTTILGTDDLNVDRIAVLPGTLGAGDSVVAYYAGDTLHAASSSAPFAQTVTVTVTPATVGLHPDQTLTFSATVNGTTDTSVIWSVEEAGGGTIDAVTGFYTAPATLGTYHVRATSVADPTKSATATVRVTLGQLVIDQTADFNIAIGGNSAQKIAQVVGVLADNLVGIRVPMTCGAGTALTVEIQEVVNGVPNGVVLATKVLADAQARLPDFPTTLDLFNPIIFDTPVPASTDFALVFSAAGSCALRPGPVGDPYPAGDGFFDARPNQVGVWVPLGTRNDIPFELITQ